MTSGHRGLDLRLDPRSGRAPAGGAPAWGALLLVSAAVVTGVEAALLEVRSGYFSSGYGGAHAQGALEVVGFLIASLSLDAMLLLALWCIAVPVLGVLGVRAIDRFALAGFFGLLVPLVLDFARYAVEAVLGRAASLALLWDLSGQSVLEMWAQSADQVPVLAWLFGLGGIGSLAVIAIARAVELRRPVREPVLAAPRLGALLGATGALALLGIGVLGSAHPSLAGIQFALGKKPSVLALSALAEQLTDLDRDGVGWLSRPPDPAPLDASIHRYAIDVPGNGIDEDGLAGDHPLDFALPGQAESGRSPPLMEEAALPPVLLIFLETFRADLIGQRHAGRPVTPFLEQLAARGASSRHMYAHTPHTFASRAQLFGGTLAPYEAQTTLIDDFRSLGYEVAHFSGQDDSFARSDVYMHVERADVFYDARQDLAARSGRGTSSGALQVSWKTLLARIDTFLDSRDRDRPLFLYVNFSDTHYPFAHAELDDLLGVTPITRGEIRPENRERVRATYANAAANVDRAIERLVERVRAQTSREPAIVITADHGEALYEDDFLGHGQRLDDAQTRVPLVLAGIGGDWPEPLGIADLRGLLRRNLWAGREGGARPQPRLVPDPERRLLQYVSRLDRPRRIRLRGLDGSEGFDFLAPGDRAADGGPPGPEHVRLIRTWEAWARLAHERESRTPESGEAAFAGD